jgi:hypothetical protein
MVDGEYKFDPTKIGAAHASCLYKFAEFLRDPHPRFRFLVVDNTNMTAVEMAPYVQLAVAYGIEDIQVHSFHIYPKKAGKRNQHGVPMSQVIAMNNRREAPLPYWPVEHFYWAWDGEHYGGGSLTVKEED